MPASSSNNPSLRYWRRAAAILVCMAAAACSPEREIDRPGTWKPTGANDDNLRAMIADRRDLDAGVPSRTSRGDTASRAVTRLLQDRRRPLLNVTTSSLAQSSGGGDAGAGGPVGGGPGGAGGATP